MCDPVVIGVAIGAAVGAAGAAATGGDPLMGALMGGIGGGFSAGLAGPLSGMTSSIGSSIFFNTSLGYAGSMGLAGGLVGGVTSTLGGVAMNMLTPQTPDYSQFGQGAQPYEPQGYSSQHAKVTGSGGRQAAAVLASEIKQAKKLRQRQEEVADFGLGMATTGTGLQIA